MTTSPPSKPPPFAVWLVTRPAPALLAALLLGLSILLPVDGLGVDLCPFYSLTHLPCPGCGLTRSVTHLGHLQLHEAIALHPFGPVVYALAAFALLNTLLGARWRRAVEATLTRDPKLAERVFALALLAFIGFGAVRLLAAGAGWIDWPP